MAKQTVGQLEAYQKERRRWAINPRTRVVQDKRAGKYSRAREKAMA